MSQDLQPGFLDRVFNSTISLPQQFAWRLWRAIEDDNIDIFSEKGIADAALLPIIGMFDDHEHDVMPDWAAAQMKGYMGGSNKRSETGFGSQLAAAVLLDPLTYMTGGLSAIGKVGKAGTQAAKSPVLNAVLRESAQASGGTLDDLFKNMTPEQFLGKLDEGIDAARQPGVKRADAQIANLQRQKRHLQGAMSEADALHKSRGAKSPLTMGESLKQTRDRRIAVGLPIFHRWGAKYNINEDYGSWWKYFKDGTNKHGTTAVKAMHLGRVMDVPGVGTALRNASAPIRHYRGGWKVGREPRVALRTGQGLEPAEAQQLQKWIGRDGASTLAHDVNAAADKLGGNDAVVKQVQEAYKRNIIERKMPHDEAFKRAMRSARLGSQDESAQQIYGRLSGRGKDSDFFPKWGAGTHKGEAAIGKLIPKMMDEHAAASRLNQRGESAIIPEFTENKHIKDLFQKEAKDLLPGMQAWANTSFELGQSAKGMWNTVFRTGESSLVGEKAYAQFLSNVARDNDQLELMTESLYRKLNEITQGDNALSVRDTSKLVTKLTELYAMPGEVAASFRAMEMNPSNIHRVMGSMDNFMKRQRQSMTTIRKLLKKGGIEDQETADKLLGVFDDEIFPFLEHEAGHISEQGQELYGLFNRLIKNTREDRLVFTPAQQRLMRRASNRHVIIGHVPEGRTKNVLGDFEGRQAGTLTDDEIGNALTEIDKAGQRAMTHEEIVAMADEMPAVQQFAKRHNVTTSEALRLLSRPGKGQNRLVPREVSEPIPLWAEGRTRWTAQQATDEAAKYGFDIRQGDPLAGEVNPLELAGTPALLKKYYDKISWHPSDIGVNKAHTRIYQWEGKLYFTDDVPVTRASLKDEIAKEGARRKENVLYARERLAKLEKIGQKEWDEWPGTYSQQWYGSDYPPTPYAEVHRRTKAVADRDPDEVTELAADLTDLLKNWDAAKAGAKQQADRFYLTPNKVTEATLKKNYGFRPEGYRTYGEAMYSLRGFLAGNAKYTERYGPGLQTVKRPITIAQQEVDDLAALLSADDLKALSGKGTVFDDAALPTQLQRDKHYLDTLVERRKLSPDNPLYDEAHIPKKVRQTTAVDVPRTSEELELLLKKGDGEFAEILKEGEIGEWAINYTRGRLLMREVQNALKRSEASGLPVDIHHSILRDIEGHVEATSGIVRNLMESHLPKEFNEAMDLSQKLSNYSFETARRAGVWMPGSPVGYLPRYFNKAGRARIAQLMGNIEQTDGAILARLGVKQSQYYKRQWDEMPLDDLNDLYFELRDAMIQKGASPKLREFHNELDDIMQEAGVGVAGLKKALPWLKNERVEADPFLSLIQRFGVAQQDANLEQYFSNMLKASTGANGDSYMLGGRVVGILDDTGNVAQIPGMELKIASALKVGDAEAVKLSAKSGTTDVVPTKFLIELEDGTIQTIDNELFAETGFGMLDIGRADDAVEGVGTPQLLGQTTREVGQGRKRGLGSLFAQASLRSDLHNSMAGARGPLAKHEADAFLGRSVVVGNSNNIVGMVKSAAQVHQVTPPALRTFDAINFGIKSFQTIFRLPFHIANLSSGVFQAHLAGATPKNLAASYIDTMRFLFGNQEFSQKASMVTDLMDLGSDAHSSGFVNMLKGDKSLLQQAARMHGGGDFARFLAKQNPEVAEGLDSFENLIIPLRDGTEINMAEFIQLAGEQQLYGTFASSLTRGSSTIADNLVRIKMNALEPSMGGRLLGAPKRLMDKMANLSESSEVINRTATALALVREGHPMRRAIEIAKEAHVPYEKLTPFEKNVFKRFSVYYTFPRHYMPWAWSRFAEDPSKLSGISHFLRDQNIISTQEGKPNLVAGDYRVDLGRLNANLEAAGMIAAFADRVFMPASEALIPGIDGGGDTRKLRGVYSDAGITNVGGVAGMFLGNNILRDPDREPPDRSVWEEATRVAWPFKIMAQLAGKQPKEGLTAAVSEALGGAGDERSPYVQYTPLESWLTDSVLGVGARKVRDKHEVIRANMAAQRMIKRLQMRAAATQDPEKRARYISHARQIAGGLRGAVAEAGQKDL